MLRLQVILRPIYICICLTDFLKRVLFFLLYITNKADFTKVIYIHVHRMQLGVLLCAYTPSNAGD